MQGALFSNDTTDVAPVQSKSTRRKPKPSPSALKEGAGGDGRPNLMTLDTRIYGLQIPINICRGDVRIAHLTDEEAEAWKRKYLPLKFVYTDDDFTPEGQVRLLRQRGLSFWDVARDFPDLADAAVRMAIDAGQAIA